MKNNFSRSDELKWQETWATACHCIWLRCNKKKFEEHFIMPHNMVATIHKLLQQYTNSSGLTRKISMRSRFVIHIKWEPPELGWLTLNTSGAVWKNAKVSCGKVLRDSSDNWIIGYTKYLGRSNNLQAELWGILEEMKMIQNKANLNFLCSN